QAIGCLGMRACHTNNCPVGIATQKPQLRARLLIEQSAKRLHNFFEASKELMQVVARACGYDDIRQFNQDDLTTFDYDMHRLSGVKYAGVIQD
ncbi:MAG: glutamate synthase, partial [Bacteroidetes bacterium]